MGEVVYLDRRRRAPATTPGGRWVEARAHRDVLPAATFHFELGAPGTYLAAERVVRLFGDLVWRPVLTDRSKRRPSRETATGAAERAAELGMPLVWPEHPRTDVRAAMRVAAYAVEHGLGSAFVLAATRLAFCGGFDLEDPEVLEEAAAAAGLPPEGCRKAAEDASRDAAMEIAGERLVARGADRLPVLELGHQLFCGEERLAEAAAAERARRAGRGPEPVSTTAG